MAGLHCARPGDCFGASRASALPQGWALAALSWGRHDSGERICRCCLGGHKGRAQARSYQATHAAIRRYGNRWPVCIAHDRGTGPGHRAQARSHKGGHLRRCHGAGTRAANASAFAASVATKVARRRASTKRHTPRYDATGTDGRSALRTTGGLVRGIARKRAPTGADTCGAVMGQARQRRTHLSRRPAVATKVARRRACARASTPTCQARGAPAGTCAMGGVRVTLASGSPSHSTVLAHSTLSDGVVSTRPLARRINCTACARSPLASLPRAA